MGLWWRCWQKLNLNSHICLCWRCQTKEKNVCLCLGIKLNVVNVCWFAFSGEGDGVKLLLLAWFVSMFSCLLPSSSLSFPPMFPVPPPLMFIVSPLSSSLPFLCCLLPCSLVLWQSKVLVSVSVSSPDLFHVVLRYNNWGGSDVLGRVSVIEDGWSFYCGNCKCWQVFFSCSPSIAHSSAEIFSDEERMFSSFLLLLFPPSLTSEAELHFIIYFLLNTKLGTLDVIQTIQISSQNSS